MTECLQWCLQFSLARQEVLCTPELRCVLRADRRIRFVLLLVFLCLLFPSLWLYFAVWFPYGSVLYSADGFFVVLTHFSSLRLILYHWSCKIWLMLTLYCSESSKTYDCSGSFSVVLFVQPLDRVQGIFLTITSKIMDGEKKNPVLFTSMFIHLQSSSSLLLSAHCCISWHVNFL